MLAIQSYLRKGNTPSDLKTELGVHTRRHPEFPNLCLFTYDQINSPKSHPVVVSCRGIILDESQNWAVVACPFDRFFNLGEGAAAEIDWETATVFCKEDGSLVTMYHYEGKWRVATRGAPHAGGKPFLGCEQTFADIFWEIYNSKYCLPPSGSENLTFIFELCTMLNRVVVPHETPRLPLLAIRDRVTGQEISPSVWADYYTLVKSFSISSFEEARQSFENLDPLHHEGYVVCDANFNRVKVKHPGYVAIHHLGSTAGPKNFIQIARYGENSEFLAYFPEYEEPFLEVQGRLDALIAHLDNVYDKLRHIEDQKTFALSLKDAHCRYPSLLFSRRKFEGHPDVTIRRLLADCPIKTLMRVLGYTE